MKKIFFTLLSFWTLTSQSFGQSCSGPDSSGINACNVTGIVSGPGFQDPSSVPCIVQGVAYNNSDQFNMYNTFDFLGSQEVDSVQFLAITGLPAGICWATNHANNRYAANESGCLQFIGTTSASAGQYKLSIDVNAWINHGASPQRPGPFLVDQAGIKLWVRVQTPGGACIGVDTSVGTSVKEISSDVKFMNVVPNPMNANNSQLTFVAEKKAAYTLKLSDITGKVLGNKEINAIPGENRITIERNALPAGLYFISLSNGESLITQRLSIAD